MRLSALVATATACALASSLAAQASVIDINQQPGPPDDDSSPSGFVTTSDGAGWFSARSVGFGTELWRTDGVLGGSGTTRMTDIAPGPGDADPAGMTEFQGHLYFAADDGTGGSELWRVALNGTPSPGLFAELYTGPTGSRPRELTVAGNTLFFVATSDQFGTELFALDAGAAQVRLVAETRPGNRHLSGPSELTAFGTGLVFAASDGVHGIEPWVSDGTAARTRQLLDVRPGGSSSSPRDFAVHGNEAYFSADDGSRGRELWRTTGLNRGGTLLAADVEPGPASSNPAELVALPSRSGGWIVFAATNSASGRELFRYSPSARSAQLVADVRLGPSSSSPTQLTRFGTRVAFSADSGIDGERLYTCDPSGASPLRAASFPNFATTTVDHVVSAGGLLFVVTDATTFAPAVYASDGTQTGTVLLALQMSGNLGVPAPFGTHGALVSMSDQDFGIEPHLLDATSATLLADLNVGTGTRSSNPSHFAALPVDVLDGASAILSAEDPAHGEEPRVLSAAGTSTVLDLNPGAPSSSPGPFETLCRDTLFVADDGVHGRELWRTRGTPATTNLVLDLVPGAGSPGINFCGRLDGDLFFVATEGPQGIELWRTDGTTSGTTQVSVIDPVTYMPMFGYRVSAVNARGELFVYLATIYVAGNTFPPTLVRTDGTQAGTSVVRRWPVDSKDGTIYAAGDKVTLFRVYPNVLGAQLVVDAFDPSAASWTNLHHERVNVTATPVTFQGSLYFPGADPAVGNELWRTRGTPATTGPVLDLRPGTAGCFPATGAGGADSASLVATRDSLLFGADDGSGKQLWRSDGTATGTFVVSQRISGSPPWTRFHELSAVGSAGDALFESEDTLWAIADRAFSLRSIRSFAANKRIAHIIVSGSQIYFAADDGVHGREPWQLPLADVGAPHVTRYASGCSAREELVLGYTGEPLSGSRDLVLRVGPAAPGVAVVALFGLTATRTQLSSGCILLTQSFASASGVSNGRGQASISLPIPADPTLVGSTVYCQGAVVQAGGPLFRSVGLTQGLQIVLGR